MVLTGSLTLELETSHIILITNQEFNSFVDTAINVFQLSDIISNGGLFFPPKKVYILSDKSVSFIIFPLALVCAHAIFTPQRYQET